VQKPGQKSKGAEGSALALSAHFGFSTDFQFYCSAVAESSKALTYLIPEPPKKYSLRYKIYQDAGLKIFQD